MRQMNNNDSILTHHEQLRLDYLQKNIHYLNEKESRELEYLLYKKELRDRHTVPQQPKPRHVASAYEDDFESDYFDDDIEQESILPSILNVDQEAESSPKSGYNQKKQHLKSS